jgi:hypothetical protein
MMRHGMASTNSHNAELLLLQCNRCQQLATRCLQNNKKRKKKKKRRRTLDRVHCGSPSISDRTGQCAVEMMMAVKLCTHKRTNETCQ